MASGSVFREPAIAGSRRTDLVLGTLVLVVSTSALVTNALSTYEAVGYGVVTLLQLPSVLLRRYRPRAAMLAGAVPATLGFAVGVPSHTLVWAVLAFALFRAPGRALGLLILVLAGALGAAAVGPPLLLGTPADVVRTTVLGLSVLLVLYAGIGAALGRVTRIARARERERHRAEEQERTAAALDAERIRIVDEVGDGVLQGLRRLTARASALAGSVPAASDPAAVSRLHEEARDVLAGMRRALSALREPVPVTGPDPGGAGRKPFFPAPTRSGLALAALLGLGAAALGLLGLEPVGDAVTDRFIALLDVPWTNPVSVALLLVQLLAVAWWRSAPISAFAVTTVVAIVNGSLGGTNQIVETGWMVLAYGVGVGSVVRVSAAVVAGGTLAVLVAYLAVPALYAQAPLGPGQVVLAQLVVVALWLVGVTRRGHRVQAETERRERRHRAEVRAREGERLRVARELHDVVAHHVSAISVQAGAATVTTDPAVRDEAFAHIGESGRRIAEALPQLESLTPNPGGVTLTADGLEDLVRPVRDAGVPVTCAVLGEPADPPGDPELFAQRILTEALTNVVRYAGPSATHVSLEHGPDAVSLRVTDTGPAIGHRPETGGSGLGLVGMRERAELLGGRVDAGHGDDGGWCVRARLPRRGGSPPSGRDRTSDLGRAADATHPSGPLPSTITTTSPRGDPR